MLEVWNLGAERGPAPADPSADGTLPTRAFRYCEAVRLASAWGLYAYAPQDFALLLRDDGRVEATLGDGTWHELPRERGMVLPGTASAWERSAPAELQDCIPPSLTALREPGTVQVWTGLMVRSPADWRLAVRAPANLPAQPGYWLYDGVMEAARARPLFTNLRLTRMESEVWFLASRPFIQVMPVPLAVVAQRHEAKARGFADMPWGDFEATVLAPNRGGQVGDYAREERRAVRSSA